MHFTRHFAAATLLALLGAASAANAQQAARTIHPFVGLGITGGGKTLATVVFTNGETAKVKSGGLVDLRVGLDWRPAGAGYSGQVSAGYFVDRANASNGSIRFQRYPFELLGYGHVGDNVRLGGGLRATTGAKISGSGFASTLGNTSFKTSPGAVFEGEYRVGKNLGFTGRYVVESYKAPNGVKVSGNHIGARMNAYF